MRYRLLLAALLAGSTFSPLLAQNQTATGAALGGAIAERMNRADVQEMRRGGGNWRGGDRGVQGQRPDAVQRAPNMPVAVPPQAEARIPSPPPATAGRFEPGRRWDGGNGGRADDWQRGDDRPAPPRSGSVSNTPTQVAPQYRGNWDRRDNNSGQRWDGQRGDEHRDADRGHDWNGDRDWDHNRDWDRDRRWNGDRDNRHWDGNSGQRWDNERQRDYGRNNDWRGRQSWNGDWRGNGSWNSDWRRDRRYDWERYRYANRSLYRMPRYNAPYGYGYQRFGIGISIGNGFFGSQYRISDPWRYRLPDARWPYQWVRYYDDVLLVDTRSGSVVDAIYDFFW